ncbi:hypothetical protein KCQ77_01035 [Corynebacterium sp. L24]|nr:hypothetical protein [Corynebacterium parakroppenstedtii]MBY0793925.1 hypothetical protein [Corynebacterium parakroppenstedtii]
MFTTTLWRLTSHDPLHNLAFERYLFSSLGKKEAAVVIWRNSPAVMVGRTQNPGTKQIPSSFTATTSHYSDGSVAAEPSTTT